MEDSSTPRSPLYEAQNAQRYERQLLIREYEENYDCRLAVVADTIFSRSITLFEEVLYDADPEQPLHVILSTPGGDGEVALRLARQAQFRCSELMIADLRGPLLDDTRSHGATISTREAANLGLPVDEASPDDGRWKQVWRLWAKYAVLDAEYVYEGAKASHVRPYKPASAYQ